MWRDGEGNRVPAQITGLSRGKRGLAGAYWARCGENIPSPAGRRSHRDSARSGTRDDRGARKGVNYSARGSMPLVRAREQHPALESARTHERETLEYPVADVPIVGGHQSDRLDQAGKQFRLTQRFLQEHLAIESPVLGADIGKPYIGVEMAAGDIAQAYRGVRQFREYPGLVGIGHEPRGIDDGLAAIQFRMQEIGKHLGRRRSAPLAAENADTDRTVEFVAIEDAEGEIVRLVIVSVGDALGLGRQDRALAQVGAVSQTVDLVLLLGSLCEAVIYKFEG